MIKVGLLVDSLNVPRWASEVVDELRKTGKVDITLVVINESVRKPRPVLKTGIYRFLRAIDRKLMPVSSNPFARKKLNTGSAALLPVKPVQTRFSDKFPSDVIHQIRLHDIDILIRFGFRILRGDILKVARYGILSLHHGDTDSYRGGPPAFWEVVNKESLTTVTIQQLTEQLDGGNLLGKTHLRTDKN
jgi:hypothetical protein